MKANFVDLDSIIQTKQSAWIVSKADPNIPIHRIAKHKFNIFKSGIYRSQNNKIDFNGKTFWLDNDTMEILTKKCKKLKCDISQLGISMQEFLNTSIIDDIEFDFDMSCFRPMINQDVDIYIIATKLTKKNYTEKIKEFEEKLKEMGLSVKDHYFLSETFYNRNRDEIAFYKVKILIQHLIGLKIENEIFTDEKVQQYDQVSLFDDSYKTIHLAEKINTVLEKFILKSDRSEKLKIKETMKEKDLVLKVNKLTNNKVKPIETKLIPLVFSNVIRSFENYSSGFDFSRDKV